MCLHDTSRVAIQTLRESWEHTFVTAQPYARASFRRAIERRALGMAEDAARELPNLPFEDALQLLHLYFKRGTRSSAGTERSSDRARSTSRSWSSGSTNAEIETR